jgi:hypothetical protein
VRLSFSSVPLLSQGFDRIDPPWAIISRSCVMAFLPIIAGVDDPYYTPSFSARNMSPARITYRKFINLAEIRWPEARLDAGLDLLKPLNYSPLQRKEGKRPEDEMFRLRLRQHSGNQILR